PGLWTGGRRALAAAREAGRLGAVVADGPAQSTPLAHRPWQLWAWGEGAPGQDAYGSSDSSAPCSRYRAGRGNSPCFTKSAEEPRRFTLPPEHAPALAQEGGPVFFGGIYQELPAVTGVLDQLTVAFRAGGGVPQSAYSDHLWDGLERFTSIWFENLLTPQWLPAMPDVQAKL